MTDFLIVAAGYSSAAICTAILSFKYMLKRKIIPQDDPVYIGLFTSLFLGLIWPISWMAYARTWIAGFISKRIKP